MTEETGYFTSFDGLKLFYRIQGDSRASRRLFIVHGFGEHSGRYSEAVRELISAGLRLYAFDLRGHGRSEGRRVDVERFSDYVKDLEAFRRFADQKESVRRETPNFLLGQSLGGLIATAAVLQKQEDWAGLVLLSPFFGLPFGEGPLRALASILSLIVPRVVWDNPIAAVYLTHDREELAKYLADPLIQRRITLRLAREMFEACRSFLSRASEISIPVLILASGNDRIVSTSKTKSFFERLGSRAKRFEVFKDCFHELIHETERGKIISLLKTYLTQTGL